MHRMPTTDESWLNFAFFKSLFSLPQELNLRKDRIYSHNSEKQRSSYFWGVCNPIQIPHAANDGHVQKFIYHLIMRPHWVKTVMTGFQFFNWYSCTHTSGNGATYLLICPGSFHHELSWGASYVVAVGERLKIDLHQHNSQLCWQTSAASWDTFGTWCAVWCWSECVGLWASATQMMTSWGCSGHQSILLSLHACSNGATDLLLKSHWSAFLRNSCHQS